MKASERVTRPQDEAFRGEVRAWFAENPPPPRLDTSVLVLTAEQVAAQRAWQRRLAEAGWAGIAWPVEFGGRGADPAQQLVFHEEHQRMGGGGAELFFVGLSHAGPTLISHGSDDLRRRFLPGILRGDILFCQCFSEPGAGSDLASLSASGVVDGEHLVVRGEKRWSTYAQYADYCELLVRTDPGDRYGSLTYLVANMRTPGITVRPVRTMSGGTEYTEVFFEDARIPLANVVGRIGDGWKVATTTLQFERSTAFAATVLGLQHSAARLAARVADDPVAADQLAALACDAFAVRALLYNSVSEQRGHAEPGPGSSALKLVATEVNYALGEYAALAGATGGLEDYFEAFGLRIGGGTSEIQRNIIAERVLGLPREPNRR